MAIETKISWSDATHNFWTGCRKISPECAYCYAERWSKRTGRDFNKVIRTKNFDAPLRWKEPRVIFTCSLYDFFLDGADQWRDDAWEVIRKANWHKWLILSKRWNRIGHPFSHVPWLLDKTDPWPHVFFGASAGNQRMLEFQLPQMLAIPAAGYFVSAEPLLGPLDFFHVNETTGFTFNALSKKVGISFRGRGLDAVIVGGESGGPEYRRLVWPHECGAGYSEDCLFEGRKWEPKPDALAWVRSIRDQCLDASVTFLFKQWGGPRPDSGGAMLDGREWKGMP